MGKKPAPIAGFLCVLAVAGFSAGCRMTEPPPESKPFETRAEPPAPHPNTPRISDEDWAELQSLAGVDLVASSSEVRMAARKLGERLFTTDDAGLEFRLCGAFRDGPPDASGGCYVIEFGHSGMFPSEGYGRVRIIGADRAAGPATEFCLGWRQSPAYLKWRTESSLGMPVLEIGTQSYPTGTLRYRQYYVLTPARALLVRLLDRGERLVGACDSSGFRVGPARPARSRDQWEEALMSRDCTIVLESLVCLSDGVSVDDAKRRHERDWLRDLKSSPGVRKRLDDLHYSRNPWIREASRFLDGVLPQGTENLSEDEE